MLKISVYLRPFEGTWFLSFISMPIAVAFEQILTHCSLVSCCSAVVAAFSIALSMEFKEQRAEMVACKKLAFVRKCCAVDIFKIN